MSQPDEDPKDDPKANKQPPSEQPVEETRIIIRADGEVVIENLTERLAEVALELDPDSELACRIETEDDQD